MRSERDCSYTIKEYLEDKLKEIGLPTDDITFSIGHCQSDFVLAQGEIEDYDLFYKYLEKNGVETKLLKKLDKECDLKLVVNQYGAMDIYTYTDDDISDYEKPLDNILRELFNTLRHECLAIPDDGLYFDSINCELCNADEIKNKVTDMIKEELIGRFKSFGFPTDTLKVKIDNNDDNFIKVSGEIKSNYLFFKFLEGANIDTEMLKELKDLKILIKEDGEVYITTSSNVKTKDIEETLKNKINEEFNFSLQNCIEMICDAQCVFIYKNIIDVRI